MHRLLRSRLEAARPPWLDLAMALLFTAAATWLALQAGDHTTGAGLVPSPPDGSDPTGLRSRPEPIDPGAGGDGPSTAVVTAASTLVTMPLAWRRRAPLAVFVVQFLASLAVAGGGTWVTFVALLIGAYSLAVDGRRPYLAIGTLLAAATVVALSFSKIAPSLPDRAVPFAILVPIALLGTTIRTARARVTASAERAEALRRGREAATRAAVAEERARIARELHDVVSHHVSVMVIQAGAAEKMIDRSPDLTRGALGAIQASGREAMGELRHLLGLLVPAGQDDLLRPQPGLDQLDALVAKVRAAGQPVTVCHTAVRLPHGVDIAAYRVVQEALTNALRYASGAPTTVVVKPDDDALVVEVTDEGTTPAGHGGKGTGMGLMGLAERLRLYGGTLETGRRLGGGFRVSARIPLDPP
ncbi:sensor histidine kinase [Acrocarpospora macrocephala]|nr:histidine kinase [Acrocarpospora macrocephala]